MILGMSFPNIAGVVLLSGVVKARTRRRTWRGSRAGAFATTLS